MYEGLGVHEGNIIPVVAEGIPDDKEGFFIYSGNDF